MGFLQNTILTRKKLQNVILISLKIKENTSWIQLLLAIQNL